ncbi:hypothetical protein [Streptomyces sp. bgisy095]|uniref:hypothetical protein n=1 Tax=unclassified Streptomyces TaxID=2593676 RepID=UPI003D764416
MRALYLCEGSSDTGLRFHIEAIAADMGREVLVTVPDLDRLPISPGRTVADKLRTAQQLSQDGRPYDVLVIHRDSDREPPRHRREEIAAAVGEISPGVPHVPVVPVRMLEAWLLLDHAAIREVAGNPNGRVTLKLPQPARVESVADPKKALKDAIAAASEERGRGLQRLQARFPANRARLLQMLDRNGPVTRLSSWQSFTNDLRAALGGP